MLHETVRDNPAIQAVVRLLADDDAKVLRLCRSQLLEWGNAARADLESAELDDNPRVRLRARPPGHASALRRHAAGGRGVPGRSRGCVGERTR